MLHQSTRRKNPSAFPRALCILLFCSILGARHDTLYSALQYTAKLSSFLSSAPPPSLENCLDFGRGLFTSRALSLCCCPAAAAAGREGPAQAQLWLCVRIKTICVIGWPCWDFNARGRPHVACDLVVETSMEKKGFCKSTGQKAPSQSLK